jgi:KaiC/GvpD/RAD55 family RecA-like ATPase
MRELTFQSTSDRIPQNLDAEEAVLGGILQDPTAIYRISNLPVEAFCFEPHRKIYRAALALHSKQTPINLLTVTTWLLDHKQLEAVGGQCKLADLVDRTVSAINIDGCAKILTEKYLKRQIISFGQRITHLGYETLGDTDELLIQIAEEATQFARTATSNKEEHDYWRYSQLISDIRDIELKIPNPGLRTFKLQDLAKKYNRSPRQLEDIYYKSLINEENEPLMDLNELAAKYGSSIREWFLHGFLPKRSTILLHAQGGVGKTRLAYNLFYHLATGTNWDGFPVTAPKRRCLIVQTDESPSDMLQALEDRGINTSLDIRYKTRWVVDYMQQLQQEIETYKPEIVLIDSLTSVNRNSTFTENDTEYARPILMLRDLAQQYGCTILIVHHSNAEGGSRGSRAIFNSVSEVWSLKRVDQQPGSLDRILSIEKSRSRCPANYRLQFNPEDKSWACLGKEGEEENNPNLTTKDLIVDYLTVRPGITFEAEELIQVVGGAADHIKRCAYQLAEDGVINRRRLNKRGRPYGYFISFDLNDDQKESEIRKSNQPLPCNDSSLSDHLIEKNSTFSQLHNSKNAKSNNQIPKNVQNPDPASVTISDHISDNSDHQIQIKTGDRVGIIMPGSKYLGCTGIVRQVIKGAVDIYSVKVDGSKQCIEYRAVDLIPSTEKVLYKAPVKPPEPQPEPEPAPIPQPVIEQLPIPTPGAEVIRRPDPQNPGCDRVTYTYPGGQHTNIEEAIAPQLEEAPNPEPEKPRRYDFKPGDRVAHNFKEDVPKATVIDVSRHEIDIRLDDGTVQTKQNPYEYHPIAFEKNPFVATSPDDKLFVKLLESASKEALQTALIEIPKGHSRKRRWVERRLKEVIANQSQP